MLRMSSIYKIANLDYMRISVLSQNNKFADSLLSLIWK